jgi:hypothetical protein
MSFCGLLVTPRTLVQKGYGLNLKQTRRARDSLLEHKRSSNKPTHRATASRPQEQAINEYAAVGATAGSCNTPGRFYHLHSTLWRGTATCVVIKASTQHTTNLPLHKNKRRAFDVGMPPRAMLKHGAIKREALFTDASKDGAYGGGCQ